MEQVTTARPVDGPWTDRRLRMAVIMAVLAAGLGVLYAFEPTTAGFYPSCVFYKATGLYCPGCGSTRTLHALVHMDLAGAFSFNPMLVVALPFLIYSLAKSAYGYATGRALNRRLLPANLIWTIFFLITAYWILRNIPAYPFSLLAPG